MKSETSVANVTMGASVSGGLIATVNDYAVVISLSLTLIGIMIGVVFHVLALKDRRERLRLDKESIRKEAIREFKERNKEI
jgi:uncharacterized membrane protein YgaE (UPF0421/DUF939 family)